MTTPTLSQLSTALTTLGLPKPHPSFLAPILLPAPGRALPPLQALAATAKHRLLSSDLATPGIFDSSVGSLPPQITDVKIASSQLPADVFVQVVGIEDLSRSKWDQIEALEMERKGETTKGREVIRVVPSENDEPSFTATLVPHTSNSVQKSSGPFKLEFQDIKGAKVYGFELKRVEKIGYPPSMNIGCKVMLKRGCKVSRGMLMLDPRNCIVLGGKIESLDKAWREGREQALREKVRDGRT
ncbi:hypothetical protein B0O99DRAFT_633698 [Bisporella sp. PMI_857]|nr:hypothetical protein B0O99DRAFT_633698 [Bisporella sp. PMI_857]